MTLNFVGRLAVAGCLAVLSLGCDDSSAGVGGAAGAPGTGGSTGAGGPRIPGLWEGRANGFDVCFYVAEDGGALAPNGMCNVTGQGQPDAVPRSFDLGVDTVGTDETGAPCSFELSFTAPARIDPATNSFRATEVQAGAEVAFSGELIGDQASGVARRDSEGSSCRVGWAATRSAECDEPAIQSCLDLLDCCRATLVNPVFFQSCDSVALQCDQVQCLQVLAGYPQCAPEPDPEMDAGTPDGG